MLARVYGWPRSAATDFPCLRGRHAALQLPMTTTNFWLIRHGETEWNASRKLQGWLDIPLSRKGIEQAERLSRYLRSDAFTVEIDAVVSSDLGRAYDTAVRATGHLGLLIERHPSLRERNYGIYEGHDWTLLNGKDPKFPDVNFRDLHQPIENGESLAQFAERITRAFNELARRHPGQNLMVFAHGGVIDVVWRKANNVPFELPRPAPILNTSINQFLINDARQWREVHWGQVFHLDDALDDVM